MPQPSISPDDWGILSGYEDVSRRWHSAPAATAAALAQALGRRAPPSPQPADPFEASPGREETCHLPPDLRSWGWAIQLPAVRSRSSWGLGDLGDLRRLAAWSSGLGAGHLFLNPLHAPVPLLPLERSPYYPSSRRFRNPLYIQVEEAPGWAGRAAALEPLAREARTLNDQRLLDRDRVWPLKMAALEDLFAVFTGSPELDAYTAEMGRPLEDHARFCALSEVHGGPWQQWPARFRHPTSAAVDQFARERHERVAFQSWLQWLLDRQLAGAGAAGGLVADLAVGVDPGGSDAWADQDLLLPGFTVGSPPDPFSAEGQNWQQATYDPWRLADAGFKAFRDVVRAGLRHAAGLRIDHVMGLWRLFVIPTGASPAEGVYLRFPHQQLLDVVAEESRRAKAVIVGEDLGTVDRKVRREMLRRRMLGYRLAWFERRPPARYPARSLAALTTHDLPTLAGLWSAADGEPLLRRRLERYFGLADDATLTQVAQVVDRELAESPAMLVAVTLEDTFLVPERPNHPGGSDGRWPNWSLSLPASLEEMERDARAGAVAAVMRGAGR